jgi:phosphoglycolate phosphatase-like HAD superfamily hydrolase
MLERVDLVVGRGHDSDPKLLKPSPFLVLQALRQVNAPTNAAVLVGDSTSEVEAARAACIPSIGYANKPGKHDRLARAGAIAVIASMAELADCLRRISHSGFA